MKKIKIGLHGASGKIGKVIAKEIRNHNLYQLVGEYSLENSNNIEKFIADSEVVIDFSTALATEILLSKINNNVIKLVIGTTGLNKKQTNLLTNLSKKIPILYSSNMSIGANLISLILQKFNYLIKEIGFDVSILDIHNKEKKDAPSGTALMFAQDLNITQDKCSSIRLSDTIATHQIWFAKKFEELTIKHHVTNRKAFAIGSLLAAKWIYNKKAGLYNMHDFLGWHM